MNLLKNTLLVAGFFSVITAFADVIPYKEAIEQAKTQKKDIVLICIGSDWLLKDSVRLEKAFKAQNKTMKNADKLIWAIHDEKNNPTEDEKKIKRPPTDVWSYPALYYLDSENRTIDYVETISTNHIAQISNYIFDKMKIRQKRDGFWGKVNSITNNLEKAECLGKGFDAFMAEMEGEKMRRIKGNYKKQFEEMKRFDPKDEKGWTLKYSFWYQPMVGQIEKFCKENKFADAENYLNLIEANPLLNKEQKQLVKMGKYRVAMRQANLKNGVFENQEQFKKSMAYLDAAIRIDPKSDLAKDCLRQKQYYTEPVILPSLYWRGLDSRPYWAKTSVDVSDSVKTAGIYVVEFNLLEGNTRFRNFSFLGKSIDIPKNKRTFSFEINVPKNAQKKILSFEMQGEGWFDGKGDINITKK